MAAPDTATSDGWLETGRDGGRLYLRHWDPPQGTPASAVLLIVHGFSWHSLYFGELGTALAAAGVAATAFDLQGHGRSGAPRGMRGWAPLPDCVADVEAALAAARARAPPGAPAFLLGESMGGAILLRALQLRPQLRSGLAGLVLLSPVIRVSRAVLPPAPVLALLRLAARLAPRLPVPDDSIRRGFAGAFGDQEFAARAARDPLVVFDAPRVGMAVSVLDACAAVAADLEAVDVPLLALHGALDSRTEPANTEELGRRAASADKTVRLVDGAQHQLLQDARPITEAVLAEVVAWVAQRTARAQANVGGGS